MAKRKIRTLPRDDDGAIRKRYFGRVVEAIETADAETLLRLVGELHVADLGAVVEALEPEQRRRLVELLGIHFDFTALTEVDDTVREEILEELPPQTVAEGVRDTRFRRRGRDPRRPAEGRADRDPRAASGARARRARAQPRLSGELRRPAHADRVHRRAAGLDRRPDDRLYARNRRSAGALLRALRRSTTTGISSAPSRSTVCCAPSARCRSRI